MKIVYFHCIVLLAAASFIACGKQAPLDNLGAENSAISISLAPAAQDYDIDRVMVTVGGEGMEPMARELGIGDRIASGIFSVPRGATIEVFAEAYEGNQLRYTAVKSVNIPYDSESVFVHMLLEADEQREPDDPKEPDEPDEPDRPDEPEPPDENVRFLVSTRAGLVFVNMMEGRNI